MKLNRDMVRSPQMIFIMYIAASGLLIMGFRFIFPGEDAPLPVFSRNWRLIQGALDFFTLFPALAFSALVVPFGIAEYEDDYYTSFSPGFFQRLVRPVIIAICAAAVYGVISFLALPLVRNAGENMRYEAELYRLAKERAYGREKDGEWLEVSQLLAICNRVWPDSPELSALRTEAAVHIDELRYVNEDKRAAARANAAANSRSAAVSAMPGQRQPVDFIQAMTMAEAALDDGRLYDAHWLATLGGRISREGSPEAARARRLAARAWNQIESMSPTKLENRQYAVYRLKLSGYEAMLADDWIRGFYIFQELLKLTPGDPDAANFLAACEKGTKEIAFFIEEMKTVPGETLTGAVLSLPAEAHGGTTGRAVLRIASLSLSPDYAYGTGIEYAGFDAHARPVLRLQAPYAKILPFTVDGQHKVLFLMRALDRHDQNRRWEPEAAIESGSSYRPGDSRITLDVSYETFVMLSRLRQGLPNLQISELFSAAAIAGESGYVSEVFEAEVLNRLGSALFFLPMAILSIIIGWRFRAKSRSRYFFVLLLPLLPIVFNGMVQIYRSVLGTAGIWLLLALGFSGALAVFITILAASFILSLIILAAQHG
ncbi:MAG: hypothetical protein LBD48_06285 [Treponema sp.]|nr:hypothetical protein [Treponema sp.]